VLSVNAERAARLVLAVCILAELTFVVLDYHVNYGRGVDVGALRRLFNTAREDGLASWFGTTQTLLAATTLWLTYAVARSRGNPSWQRTGWLILAAFFTYMAVDDGAQLHERLGSTIDALKEESSPLVASFPSYTWQLLFLPIYGALGAFMTAFLWHELPARSSRIVLVTALGCLVLAVVLDFIEGLEPEHAFNLHTWLSGNARLEGWARVRFGRSAYDTLQHFSRSIEETLEMLANSLLWFLFLGNLPRVAPDGLRIVFEPKRT